MSPFQFAPRSALLGLVWLVACGKENPAPDPLLREISAASGLDFVHATGAQGNRELPETMGAGVALFDADLDGDVDVYCVQSGSLRLADGGRAAPQDSVSQRNALYINDGQANFSLDPASSAELGYGQGVAAGDFDGDGRADLYVLNWGPNVLLRSTPEGLVPVPEACPSADAWSVSATFFDAEGDGDLDLYEVNYLICPPGAYRFLEHNSKAPLGFEYYAHPDRFLAEPDRLLVNDGSGRFSDQSGPSGIHSEPAGKGLGVVATDLELDGQIDLFVANDSTPNFLLHNLGAGRFEHIGQKAGVAFNDDGLTEASMGVDTADVDQNGAFDLFCTNLDQETATLYLAQASEHGPRFRDRTRLAGLEEPTRPYVGFGALFQDLDGDSFQDLLLVNGHIIDNIARIYSGRTYAQPNQIFRANGRGSFELIDMQSLAPAFANPRPSRSLASGDLNGDGTLDFVVTNSGEPVQVFLGRPYPGPSLRIELDGGPQNPHGLGASLFLEYTDDTRRLFRIEASRSYASSCEPVLVLGNPKLLRAILVLWPGGTRQSFEGEAIQGSRLRLQRADG